MNARQLIERAPEPTFWIVTGAFKFYAKRQDTNRLAEFSAKKDDQIHVTEQGLYYVDVRQRLGYPMKLKDGIWPKTQLQKITPQQALVPRYVK